MRSCSFSAASGVPFCCVSRFRFEYRVINGGGDSEDRTKGRPTEHTAADALGLILMYMKSRIPVLELQYAFGIATGTIDRVISRGLDAMLRVLVSLPEAAIAWPTSEQICVYARMIHDRHGTFACGWAVVDGSTRWWN